MFVARDGFYFLLHALGVIVLKVLLYALFISAFGLPDPPPQSLLRVFVFLRGPRFKGRVPCSEQGPHLAVEPRFLIRKDFDGFCPSHTFSTKVYVGEDSRCVSLQICLSKYVPVCGIKAVL